MLVGLNASLSWFFGTVFAFGFVGPLLVKYGEAVGTKNPKHAGTIWEPITKFNGMTVVDDPEWIPSPRYWFLWPGVMVLICYSLVEFLLQFRVMGEGIMYAFREAATSINERLQARGK